MEVKDPYHLVFVLLWQDANLPLVLSQTFDQAAELGGRALVSPEARGDQGAVDAQGLEAIDDFLGDVSQGLEFPPARVDVPQEFVQFGTRTDIRGQGSGISHLSSPWIGAVVLLPECAGAWNRLAQFISDFN